MYIDIDIDIDYINTDASTMNSVHSCLLSGLVIIFFKHLWNL